MFMLDIPLLEDRFEIAQVDVLRRLDLQDGDILVLSFPGAMSSECADRINADLAQSIRNRLGIEISVLVLEDGGKLEGIIRGPAADFDTPSPE